MPLISNNNSEAELGKGSNEQEVEVTIKYQSKTVRQVLDKQYEAMAKALLYRSPLRIATAVVLKFVTWFLENVKQIRG